MERMISCWRRFGCPRDVRSPRVMPKRTREDRWHGEVQSLREMLLREYGPFLSRNPGAARDCRPAGQHLVDLDALVETIRRSDEMSARLRTSARAMRFLEWLSDRTCGSSAVPAAVRESARKVARLHGLRGPLVLPTGPPWVFTTSLLEVFERSDGLGSLSNEASASTSTEEEDGDEAEKRPPRRQRRSLSKAVRNAVWNEWIGLEKGVGPCHCCGRQISQQDYECGHVVAASRGGSDFPDNLRPLCRACNRSMRDEHMYEFQARVGFFARPQPDMMDLS